MILSMRTGEAENIPQDGL